ncbi:MAG: hypothetical protein HY807_00065, partial [Nitrospirae bacterium]|nr:hypothetical protein [Nitrospirota bacterium]
MKYFIKQSMLLAFLLAAVFVLPQRSDAAWTTEVVDDPRFFQNISKHAIAVDSDGIPHIVYGADSLYHAYFNGNEWHYETIYDHPVAGLYSSSMDISFTLDADDNLHIVFPSRDSGILYATNKSGAWTVESVVKSGNDLSIAVDSAGKAHISYRETIDTVDINGDHSYTLNLKYATNASGSWVFKTIDTGRTGWQSSIAVDSSGKIHIAYLDMYIDDILKYATNSSGLWNITTIDNSGNVGSPSITIDSSNKAHVIYLDTTDGLARNFVYANNRTGAWIKEYALSGQSSSVNISGNSLDPSGKLHFLLMDTGTIKHVTNSSGSWTTELIANGAINPYGSCSMTLDNSGKVHTAYVSTKFGETNKLNYLTNHSGNWAGSLADSGSSSGNSNSIAVDSSGHVHISYINSADGKNTTFGKLSYASNASGTWRKEVIDNLSHVYSPDATSIAVDRYGYVHISYYDSGSRIPKYATNAYGKWVIENVDIKESAIQISGESSIALDSSGKVHISYSCKYTASSSPQCLAYVTNATGAWTHKILYSGAGSSKIAIDSLDNVHIGFISTTSGTFMIMHITNAVGEWVSEQVGNSYEGRFDMALDSYDNVHFVYLKSGIPSITTKILQHTVKKNDAWTSETFPETSSSNDNIRHPKIVLDPSDNVHILYQDGTVYQQGSIKYISNVTGAWVSGVVDDKIIGSYLKLASMAVDSSDNIHVSYYDGNYMSLKYAFLSQASNDHLLSVGIAGTGSVKSIPNGIDCGSDCSEIYPVNTVVALSALPGAGYVFTGWSGSGCSGTGTCQVTMNAGKSVKATFVSATQIFHTLTVNTVGEGAAWNFNGIYCGSDCTQSYAEGTTVKLMASPSAGWLFSGWGGACSDIGECSIQMNEDKNVTARFIPPSVWRTETLDASVKVHFYAQSVIDSSDKLHIVYIDDANSPLPALKYMTNASGAWSLKNLGGGGGAIAPVIAVDSLKTPGILVSDLSYDLRYIKKTSTGGWLNKNIALNGEYQGGQLVIDSSDKPHILYFAKQYPYCLVYATEINGAIVKENTNTICDSTYYLTSLALAVDALGKVHIASVNNSRDITYATNSSGTWSASTIESTLNIKKIFMLLDSFNAPHIFYYTGTAQPNALTHAYYSAGSWHKETTGITGWWGSIKIDSLNRFHAAGYRVVGSLSVPLYASTLSGNWVAEEIGTNGYYSAPPSLNIDSSNNAHIIYSGDEAFPYDYLQYSTNSSSKDMSTINVKITGTGSGVIASGGDIYCGSDCSATVNNGTTITLTATPDKWSVFNGWSGGGCSGTGNCIITVSSYTDATATFTEVQKHYHLEIYRGVVGQVISDPEGIDCGGGAGDCEEDYPEGTVVTLWAEPWYDWFFYRWFDDCSGKGNCIITMNSDKIVTAIFAKALSVEIVGNGSVKMVGNNTATGELPEIQCSSDCDEQFPGNTYVTLTAVPQPGWKFAGWVENTGNPVSAGLNKITSWVENIKNLVNPGSRRSGSIKTLTNNSTNVETYLVLIDDNKSVSATFTPLSTYSLTVTKTGTGSGTVTSSPSGIDCGGDCTETLNYMTFVTFTATPSAGSAFTGWSGSGCSGTGTCIVAMTTDKSVTAAFMPNHTLTVTSACGTVTSSPSGINCGADCSEAYDEGTAVTLNAAPNAGYLISGWSGDADCADGIVTMNADKSCSATCVELPSVCTPSSIRCVPDEYQAIQSAINASHPGDSIFIEQGTYFEQLNVPNGGALTLEGGWNFDSETRSDDPSLTVIDGSDTGRVFHINPQVATPGLDLTIQGITIQNGRSGFGGGIYAINDSRQNRIKLTLHNNILRNNLAAGDYADGGALVVMSQNEDIEVILTDNEIYGNHADYDSGAILFRPYGWGTTITATINGNNIHDNTARFGAGVFFYSDGNDNGSIATISNNAITNNKTDGCFVQNNDFGGPAYAGGIGVITNGFSRNSITLLNNTISGNEAAAGAGVYIGTEHARDPGNPYYNAQTIFNSQGNTITGNIAPDICSGYPNVSNGGGVTINSDADLTEVSTFTFNNDTITGNGLYDFILETGNRDTVNITSAPDSMIGVRKRYNSREYDATLCPDSDWSRRPCILTGETVLLFDTPFDTDGVADTQEQGPDGSDMNFDGNNDGIPDCQ